VDRAIFGVVVSRLRLLVPAGVVVSPRESTPRGWATVGSFDVVIEARAGLMCRIMAMIREDRRVDGRL